MKKFILAIITTILIISSKPSVSVHASTKYARIERTTEIFKTTSESSDFSNIICLAEETYFVEILSDFKDFYKVNYNSIVGYVKKNDVKEISNTPSTPYPYNIKLTIGSNCNLRTTPTTKSSTNNVVCIVYANTNDITFIGRVIGEEAIDFGGSTWYYVNYNGNYGYVYNNYVKNITPIYSNTENFTYAKQLTEYTTNPITHTPSLIIIIILAIPIFFVLVILYLPYKQSKPKTKKLKVKKEIDRY